jgi:putative ABC transport system ATP-binding protein
MSETMTSTAPTMATNTANQPLIEVRELFKYYANNFVKTYVLQDINLNIGQGEFISIMGPSGAGKSTLLHILGMLDEPNQGDYIFFNEPVHRFNEKKRSALHREYVGFIFQAYHLIDDLTVYENLETPLLYKRVKSSERKSLVNDTLDRFNIVAKKDLFPHQLSGGQQQLVAVARALITRPKVIFADEPTGNLNSKQGTEIMEMLATLNQEEGTTIVQVTHDEVKARYANRIIHLLDGRVEREEKV